MKSLTILFLILLFSCQREPIDCFNPPPTISFRFIDKNSNADLLANGTIIPSQLTAKDETGKNFEVSVTGDDTIKIATVQIGANTGHHNYQLTNPKGTVDFSVNVYDTKKCGWAIKSREIITDHTIDKRGYAVIKF